MRLFYDTEFLEDGRTIELISIGMVAEDGRELLLVNEAIEHEPLHERICQHAWLMANVVPHLPLATRYDGTPWLTQPGPENRLPRRCGSFSLDEADNRVVSLRYIRNAVRDFIQATPDAELWAYFAAYDHVTLCQLFGAMVDLPKGAPMWTNDLQQEIVRLGSPPLPVQDGVEHNALADAKWARDVFAAIAAGTAPSPA